MKAKTPSLLLVIALGLLRPQGHGQAATSQGAAVIMVNSPSTEGVWDPRFALPPGVNGEVHCATIFRGDLYVGGRFSRAGEISAKNIARWDGHYWSSVNGGVDGVVLALTPFGNSLYVGGAFRTFDYSTTNIVRLTPHGWEPLGGGIPSVDSSGHAQTVTCIAVRGRDLFVGGIFHVAGNRAVRNVARWNGHQWTALGEGIGRPLDSGEVFGQVNALSVLGDDLYVGGLFDRAGTVGATNIARWHEGRWRPLGNGVAGGRTGYRFFGGGIHSGAVTSLAVQDRQLLVGGDFTSAGTRNATNLARWNGRSWSPFARGVSGGRVSDILAHGPEVFVTGSFTGAGGLPATNVARWDGRRWKALEQGVRGYGNSLALHGRDLFVGGYFGLAGEQPAAFVARWNRGAWHSLKPNPNPIFSGPGGVFPGSHRQHQCGHRRYPRGRGRRRRRLYRRQHT